jgi:hypothetical protein
MFVAALAAWTLAFAGLLRELHKLAKPRGPR